MRLLICVFFASAFPVMLAILNSQFLTCGILNRDVFSCNFFLKEYLWIVMEKKESELCTILLLTPLDFILLILIAAVEELCYAFYLTAECFIHLFLLTVLFFWRSVTLSIVTCIHHYHNYFQTLDLIIFNSNSMSNCLQNPYTRSIKLELKL